MYVDLVNTIVEYLFSMFFLSLLVMLFFSTGILTYTGLFHSREAAFLLTTPASADRIFAYKFVEAIGFSSWGFLLLGSPMMVAYGLTVQASPAFYAIFLLYLLSFVLIPGAWGRSAAILVANFFPRRQKTVLGAGRSRRLASWRSSSASGSVRTPGDALSSDWLGGLLQKLEFSQHPLWPSRWMSAGLLAAAQGDWPTGLFYLRVLSGPRRARLPASRRSSRATSTARATAGCRGSGRRGGGSACTGSTRSSTASSSSCPGRSAS